MTHLFTRQSTFRIPSNIGRPLLCLTLLTILLLSVVACNRNEPTPTPNREVQLAATVERASDSTREATAAGEAATATQPAAPTPSPTPPPEAAGTLTLWHSWAEADGDALATILFAFQQQYPAIQVETLFVAYNDLPQSYAEAVQANAGPDLVLMPNWWLGEMVAAGVAQSMDELLDRGALDRALLDRYWPATLDNLSWQGELYGLPINYELVSLFYNQALVSETELPQSMTDLLALAEADPKRGTGLYASLYHLYWGFPAHGAQLLNDDGEAVLDATAGAAAYLQWLAELAQVDGTYVDSDYGMLLDRFKKGEFAFLVDGPWSIAELRGALGDDLAITHLPDGTAGAAEPWLSADGIFLNPRALPEQQYLALLLAQHFSTVESGTTVAELANRVPANRHVTLDDPLLQGFVEQAASSQSLPALPEMAEAWAYGGDMLLKVLAGEREPAEVVQETTTLINEANGR